MSPVKPRHCGRASLMGPMDGLRATTATHLRPALRMVRWRSLSAIRLPAAAGYLRGLTIGRVGLVLLICAIFSVRQQSLCVFQIICGMLSQMI